MAVLSVGGTAAMTADSWVERQAVSMEHNLVEWMVVSMVALMAIQLAEHWAVQLE